MVFNFYANALINCVCSKILIKLEAFVKLEILVWHTYVEKVYVGKRHIIYYANQSFWCTT